MKVYRSDVVSELARRLRLASADGWDDDRCQIEAESFFAELKQRGWSMNPDVDWRQIPAEPRPLSDQAFTALAEARRALRAANRTTSSTQPTPTTSGGTR